MKKIKIGSRASRLALIQTQMAVDEIHRVFSEISIEIVKISTKGDRITETPLHEIGGKGIFVSEIESRLLNGEIDMAVHSAKDLPVQIADGTEISAVLGRGNPCDVFITRAGESFGNDSKFIVGTGSLRRRIAFSKYYSNAIFSDIRGNIDTRLKKLSSGEYDAVILAAAGIERLKAGNGFELHELHVNQMIPAPCQGIIAIQVRKGSLSEIMEKINHEDTYKCFETEREILRILNADCTMPIGAYSEIDDDIITLTATKDSIKYITEAAPVSCRLELAKRTASKL